MSETNGVGIQKLKEIEYALFPGRGGGAVEAHNQLYTAWRSFWGEFYRTARSEESLRADDFTRADVAAGLFYEGRVIGMQLYTFFDIDFLCTREHSYFRSWGESELAKLMKRGARRFMSEESDLDIVYGSLEQSCALYAGLLGRAAASER
jgi:hypothetical protein